MKKRIYLILLITAIFFLLIQSATSIKLRHVWNQTTDNQTNTGFYASTIDSKDNNIHAGDIDNDYGVLAKYYPNGSLHWNLTGISDYFRDIEVDSKDNIYVAGTSNTSDPSLSKYSSAGNLLWNVSFINGSSGLWYGITVDSNNDIIVSGYDTFNAYDYAWLAKYNSSGTLLWNLTFPNTKEAKGYKVAVDSNNNIFWGTTNGNPLVDQMSWLNKYNSTGIQLWNWSYAGAGAVFISVTDVEADSDDDIILLLFDMDLTFSNFANFFKFNNSGTLLWNTSYKDLVSGDAYSEEIAIDSEDNIIAPIPIDNGDYVLLVKYDTDGYMIYNETIINRIYDDFPGVAIESNNSLILGGDGKYNTTHFNRQVFKYDDGTPKWKPFYKVGKTTYLYNESDLDSVTGLILDNKTSRIQWNQAVNVSHADLTSYVRLGEGYVSINSLYLDSTFNASANVSINISDCSNWRIYYSPSNVTSLAQLKNIGTIVGTATDGCTSYCSNPVCANGQLNYTVTSFSSTGAEYYPKPLQAGGGTTAAKSYSYAYQQQAQTKQENPPAAECKESWLCSEWQQCINGMQKRTCEDWNKCGTEKTKPIIEQSCQEKTYTDSEKPAQPQEYITKSPTKLQIPDKNSHSIKAAHAGIFAILLLLGTTSYLLYHRKKK